jgi:hypothetical protein
MKLAGWSIGGILSVLIVFVALLAFPGFMFAHETRDANLTLHSDQQDIAYLLTHEVAHSLVLERIGMRRAAALPFWKTEGFPDYVAATAIRRREQYSLHDAVSRLLRSDLTSMLTTQREHRPLGYDCIGRSYVTIETRDYWNTCYLSRLLVEYQVDQQGLTSDALIDPRVNEVETWRELLAAYDAGRLRGDSRLLAGRRQQFIDF